MSFSPTFVEISGSFARTKAENCGPFPRVFGPPHSYPSHAASCGQCIGIDKGKTKIFLSVLDSPRNLPHRHVEGKALRDRERERGKERERG